MHMLRSLSMASDWNLLGDGTCIYGHFHDFELKTLLGDGMCMLKFFSVASNWKLCYWMAYACYGHFPRF